jgi:hypothetical protein
MMPVILMTSSKEYKRPNSSEFWVAAFIMKSATINNTESTASGTTPVA